MISVEPLSSTVTKMRTLSTSVIGLLSQISKVPDTLSQSRNKIYFFNGTVSRD